MKFNCTMQDDDGKIVPVTITEWATEFSYNSVPEIRMKGFVGGPLNQSSTSIKRMQPKRIIYNNPATIVLWKDGTKTVVKCDPRDIYNPELGLALCFMKKALGNTSRALNDILHKELPAP